MMSRKIHNKKRVAIEELLADQQIMQETFNDISQEKESLKKCSLLSNHHPQLPCRARVK